MQIARETIERQVTPEQVASRIRELLQKAQDGGITSAERTELDSLQDVRSRTQAAKQARDRAFQEYTKVEQLPNARSNFSAAAIAVTRQGLNDVGDVESNFLRVKQKLEQELRQPMTVENIVRVLSDGSLDGLAPNQDAEQLHLEREQQERADLIDEIVSDWSRDQHARDVKRMLLNKPHVTIESLRSTVADIRERDRLYAMTPAQIRAENAAKRGQVHPEPEKPIHVAAARADMEYPQMPSETFIDGKEVILDSKYIRRCNGDQLRHLIKMWGETQVVNRLRQIS